MSVRRIIKLCAFCHGLVDEHDATALVLNLGLGRVHFCTRWCYEQFTGGILDWDETAEISPLRRIVV